MSTDRPEEKTYADLGPGYYHSYRLHRYGRQLKLEYFGEGGTFTLELEDGDIEEMVDGLIEFLKDSHQEKAERTKARAIKKFPRSNIFLEVPEVSVACNSDLCDGNRQMIQNDVTKLGDAHQTLMLVCTHCGQTAYLSPHEP